MQMRRCGFDPWVRKIPWRRKWQLTPGSLPRKSHARRSLVGCSPSGHRELDTIQQLNNTTSQEIGNREGRDSFKRTMHGNKPWGGNEVLSREWKLEQVGEGEGETGESHQGQLSKTQIIEPLEFLCRSCNTTLAAIENHSRILNKSTIASDSCF